MTDVLFEPDATEALGESWNAVKGWFVGDGERGAPEPGVVFPVDGDAGLRFSGGRLEDEREGVDGPFAPNRGVAKGVRLAVAEKGQGGRVEGSFFGDLAPGGNERGCIRGFYAA